MRFRKRREMKRLRLHPVLLSLIYAFVPLLFAVAAGVVVAISKADQTQTMLVQTASFTLSIAAGLALMGRSGRPLSEYGFFSSQGNNRELMWFIPLLLVEAGAFMVGFRGGITLTYVAVALVFTISVGVNEELYFRGLVLKALSAKGIRFAIIVSSLIFGVVHLANLAGGADVLYTFLQVLFSALFGLVCAEIVVKSKGLLVAIIWHFVHDLIGYVTVPELSTTALVVLGSQCAVLLGYAAYLWGKARVVAPRPHL